MKKFINLHVCYIIYSYMLLMYDVDRAVNCLLMNVVFSPFFT